MIRSGAYMLACLLMVAPVLAPHKVKAAATPQGSTPDKAAANTNCPNPPASAGEPASEPAAAPGTIFNAKPTRFLAPIYPPCAESEGLSGIVDVEFKIQVDGSAADPLILRETPEGYGFGASALDALLKWKFQPKIVDGNPVTAPARSRIAFKIPEPENVDTLETAGLPLQRVNPLYPEKAEQGHKSGFVDFVFTLQLDGTVGDLAIVQEIPANYGFGIAAAHALIHWKFPPKLENGKPVVKRVKYRMSFKLAQE